MNRKQSRVREIEAKIADLKGRWPKHSVPPRMWQQLEDLEEELKQATGEETDAGQNGSGGL